jgi:hypothetical protein
MKNYNERNPSNFHLNHLNLKSNSSGSRKKPKTAFFVVLAKKKIQQIDTASKYYRERCIKEGLVLIYVILRVDFKINYKNATEKISNPTAVRTLMPVISLS